MFRTFIFGSHARPRSSLATVQVSSFGVGTTCEDHLSFSLSIVDLRCSEYKATCDNVATTKKPGWKSYSSQVHFLLSAQALGQSIIGDANATLSGGLNDANACVQYWCHGANEHFVKPSVRGTKYETVSQPQAQQRWGRRSPPSCSAPQPRKAQQGQCRRCEAGRSC